MFSPPGALAGALVLRRTGLALFALLAGGCASAGPYGHSPEYAPLDAEETAVEGAVDYDPVMIKRSPEKWKDKAISVFGVVLDRTAGAAGKTEAKLSVRTLEPRNLCESGDEESCRVTVSEHEHAIVHVLLKLDPEDDIGAHSVGPASLVRVIGKLTDEVNAADGEPVLQATYHRHWPRGFYVTTADRSHMKR